MFYNGQHAVANHAANPPRCQAKGCHAGYEDDDSRAFVPRGIGQRQVVLVGAGAVQYLSNQSQNVDRRDDDRGAGDDSPRAMEGIGMLKGTVEYGHFGYEAAEARQTEVGKTGNDIAHREEGHDFHQARQFADVTCVSAPVNHADEGKEQSRHQSVAQHLEYGAGAGCLVHHEDGQSSSQHLIHLILSKTSLSKYLEMPTWYREPFVQQASNHQ